MIQYTVKDASAATLSGINLILHRKLDYHEHIYVRTMDVHKLRHLSDMFNCMHVCVLTSSQSETLYSNSSFPSCPVVEYR